MYVATKLPLKMYVLCPITVIFLQLHTDLFYFSVPIKCYDCFDKATNTSCADPIDPFNNNLPKAECMHGVCIKMTRYYKGQLRCMCVISSLWTYS